MKIQVTSTVMISLLAAVTSHAQTWQDNPIARQMEDAGANALQVFPGLRMISLTLLMAAGLLWLFYFRSAWNHFQERSSRHMIVQMPQRGHAPAAHFFGHSDGMRAGGHALSGSGRERGSRLHAARFEKAVRTKEGDYTPGKRH